MVGGRVAFGVGLLLAARSLAAQSIPLAGAAPTGPQTRGTATGFAVSHPFFQYIEALAASGVTGGCGSGK